MITLLQFVKAFGIFRGTILYIGLRFNYLHKIKIPKISQPIYIEPHTNDNYTFKEVFLDKNYELGDIFKKRYELIIVDAGANIGMSTVFFKNRYPNSSVFCIEPESKNYSLLLKNIRNYPGIKPYHSAIWNNSGNVTIINPEAGKRSFIVAEEENSEIKALTIPELMKENDLSTIDILKIDIEGAEKELFSENYHSWLSKTKCIIIEIHDNIQSGCSKNFFRAISQFNFSCHIQGENLVCMNNDLIK
jgi:FkbM family methyltransferase